MSKNPLFQKLSSSKGNSFLVNRYTSPYFETPLHFHEEYELVYCENGFGQKYIGNSFSAYQQGEMALIGKNVPHLFIADGSFYQQEATVKPSSVVIQFQEDFLGKTFFGCPEMTEMTQVLSLSMNGVMITGKTKEAIRPILLQMLTEDKIGKLKNLIEIFGILSVSVDLKPISVATISGINIKDSLKMNSIIKYSLANYKEDIKISDVAAIVKLSASTFCRYFKSRTQKTFLSFLIEIRLNEACKLLRETERSIGDICYESGFKNLSNFNRLFRKQYKSNPVEYRKNTPK